MLIATKHSKINSLSAQLAKVMEEWGELLEATNDNLHHHDDFAKISEEAIDLQTALEGLLDIVERLHGVSKVRMKDFVICKNARRGYL